MPGIPDLNLELGLEPTARRLFSSPSPPPRGGRPLRPPRRSTLDSIAEDAHAEEASARTPSTTAPSLSLALHPPTDRRWSIGYAPPAPLSLPLYTPAPPMFQESPAPSPGSSRQRQHAAAAGEGAIAAGIREFHQGREATQPVRGYTPPAPPMFQESPTPSPGNLQQQQQAAAAAAALRELERGRQATMVAEVALRQIQQQAWAAEAARPQLQELRLYTVQGASAGYATKWEELHPVSQQLLLQIEDKMREYRHESDMLDQCSRLYDPSVNNKSFELDASQIMQEIEWTSIVMDREKSSIQGLMAVVKEMMWNMDCAIRSYVKLRPRFINSGIANAGFANRAGWSGAPADFHQPLATAPTFHYSSAAAMRPSPFMQHTVARFENQFEDCNRLAAELEQLVNMENARNHSDLKSLPKVMSNVHDYLIHVASKAEDLHQYTEARRTQYLNDRRRRGDWSEPFLEADRREAAKQEAVAKRVHPTLHLQPAAQATPPA